MCYSTGTQSASGGGLRRIGNGNCTQSPWEYLRIHMSRLRLFWGSLSTGRACFWKFAPCHLREQSFFLMKTQNESGGCQGPSWEIMSSPRKPAAGSAQALCPLPADWESGAGRPLGSFFFFSLSNWGVYWNSSVPFLLSVTNSHGSVFSVLFFFSVFLNFFFFFPPGGQNWPFK